jgi:hypothetical protein
MKKSFKISGTGHGTPESYLVYNLSVRFTFFSDKTALVDTTLENETRSFNCALEIEGVSIQLLYKDQLVPNEINLLEDKFLIFSENNSGVTINLTKQLCLEEDKW